jgi:SAM-dependent methyltransferase
VSGFFDALPVDDGWADLVISCSAFLPDPAHGGEPGLEEMERVCRPAGLIVIVWPGESNWLRRRGFTLTRFPGPMQVEFASVEEAVELARIFYPDAASRIARERLAAVPYEVLGFEGPRLLAWRRKA